MHKPHNGMEEFVQDDEIDILSPFEENKENLEDVDENSTDLDVCKHFIEAVRLRPKLYNPEYEEFKDNYLRQEKWNEISAHLKDIGLVSTKLDLDRLPYEWRKLKQRFIRAMKLRKSGNTNGSFKKGFQYFDAMQFLIPYLTIAELDPSVRVKKEVEVNEEKFDAPETSSSPLKDSNRLNISTSEAVESSNNPDLASENVITEMEVGSFEAIKIKESEEEKDPIIDHIETPTLEHIDEFTLQDSSTFMRTPTMSTIKRAFDSAFNQPMVFDEEVTSAEECVPLVISRCLGLGITAGSMFLLVPQILKIFASKSGRGISLSSQLLGLLAAAGTSAYSYEKGFVFSQWGDSLFVTIQMMFIIMQILYYSDASAYAFSFFSVCWMLTLAVAYHYVPLSILTTIQATTIPIVSVSKGIQIWTNYSNKSTGQLSLISVALQFFGCLARIFTSVQETGDNLVIGSFIVAAFLNGIIFAQMFIYWDETTRQKKPAKHRE